MPGDPGILDVQIDLETLGTEPGCSIFAIGVVPFSVVTGKTYREDGLYLLVNPTTCELIGLESNPATEKWWDDQKPEARKELNKARVAGHPIWAALDMLNAYLARFDAKRVRVWSCGAGFDLAILAVAYKMAGRKKGWEHGNERCHRSLKNLINDLRPTGVTMPNPADSVSDVGTAHHALDDADYQAQQAVKVLAAISLAFSPSVCVPDGLFVVKDGELRDQEGRVLGWAPPALYCGGTVIPHEGLRGPLQPIAVAFGKTPMEDAPEDPYSVFNSERYQK